MRCELIFLCLVGVVAYLAAPSDAMKKEQKKSAFQELAKEEAQLERKEAKIGNFDVDKLNSLTDGGKDEKRCWLKSYTRTGHGLNLCPANTEQSGYLCYPRCEAGYTGVSLGCWQNCPANYNDGGVFCSKPAAYDRGSYPLWDGQKCANNNPQGCEQLGLIHYPRCRAGYYNYGIAICTPTCPAGMSDSGATCNKRSYTRTAGVSMVCPSNEQTDAGICYPYCSSGYHGVSFVCWANCPAGYNQCGALCMEKSHCTQYVLEFLTPIIDLVEAAIKKDAAGIVGAVASAVTQFIYPICP